MSRILFVMLAVVLILTIFVTVFPEYRIRSAVIYDVDVWVSRSFPHQYFLRVVAGGSSTCWKPWKYVTARFGNIIFVRVLTLPYLHGPCGWMVIEEEKIMPLGISLVPNMVFVVVVNGAVRILVAEPHYMGPLLPGMRLLTSSSGKI